MSSTNGEKLFHLGYVSVETSDLGSEGMVSLLDEARRNNAERNLTGILLHRDRSFYLVLEGEESEVKRAFEHIEKDKRHKAIDVLFEGHVEQREFYCLNSAADTAVRECMYNMLHYYADTIASMQPA